MNLAEETFYLHLKDPESLNFIHLDGIDLSILPTEGLHPAWLFAERYFAQSGFRTAPGAQVFIDEMGDRLKDHDLDIHQDPEESIEWALAHLKSQSVYSSVAPWMKDFASGLASAVDTQDRLDLLAEGSSTLLEMSNSARSQASKVDARVGTVRAMESYLDRASQEVTYRGIPVGLAEVDQHSHGIWPGELAVVAAPPKVGKSFFLAHAAFQAWRAGKAPVLFTLENSTDMTIDRIACMAAGVDARQWQRGTLSPEHVERVREWINELETSDIPFWILQPDLGQRSFDAMVSEARIRGAEGIFIDQLTFVEWGGTDRQPKNERIGNAMHRLKGMISTGSNPIPCMLAHQINRDGAKAAQKQGYLEMWHMADASEVERTADWVFGLHASRDDVQVSQLRLQILAARREALKNWQLNWAISRGHFSCIREITNLEYQQ